MSPRAQPGRIPLPPVEIVEVVGGEPRMVAKLEPSPGRIAKLFALLTGARRKDRFLLDRRSLPPEILAGREQLSLLELDADGRPVLWVLPGMAGELHIGVSRMTVDQMLADPALAEPSGGARLPLPYGARLHIRSKERCFHVRVGGPPLIQPPLGEVRCEPALAEP
ncbi:hypothetical protein G6O69_26220 [Pseudenhygromyxa sp. WMMC2535]|uniref:hypothetical protein n=1 Tax=Pseudenhygromyxa sp. WMMC2535 TaxID=2712867 RepID=UPI0015574170|nr:hypothetical protein [Pseudenhygromyxa sp. WMMC2535]NVB41361.1 hypothetical protein [Pseudenhygromyxa sp. WMMC2535]